MEDDPSEDGSESCKTHFGASFGGLLSEGGPIFRSFFGAESDFSFHRLSNVFISLVSILLRHGRCLFIRTECLSSESLFICHHFLADLLHYVNLLALCLHTSPLIKLE